EDGEFVVILGPSGAGKSTVLNLLGGMDKATDGEIIVGGEHIERFSDKRLTEYRARSIGFVFQFYNLIPTLTAYENAALVKEVTANYRPAEETLESVGLKSHKNKFPSQLSGGEQQRVSIARALCKNPRLLLCDEPTGALDSGTGVKILSLLKDAAKAGRTVVVVTHNAAISAAADKVIRFKNGRAESVEINQFPKDMGEVIW
ncbi:MAG: ABC transporter ATP-binding protein, partial [Clostridiales bacterium]|nr:ABC transporter ATP-binding protein [Clostridiales bacterium]